MNVSLQKAKDELESRRAQRQRPGYVPASSVRHDPLQVAYQALGELRHLRILYCPACLRGHAVDLVSDKPADAPNARELELRQMRPWRLECIDKLTKGII